MKKVWSHNVLLALGTLGVLGTPTLGHAGFIGIFETGTSLKIRVIPRNPECTPENRYDFEVRSYSDGGDIISTYLQAGENEYRIQPGGRMGAFLNHSRCDIKLWVRAPRDVCGRELNIGQLVPATPTSDQIYVTWVPIDPGAFPNAPCQGVETLP